MEANDIELIRDTYNRAYEKGKQAGIKEVVEFGNQLITRAEFSSRSGSKTGRIITMEIIRDWQSKLKGWEME